MGACAIVLGVALALTSSAATIPVFISGAVAGLIGLVDLSNRKFGHRPFRDELVDARIAGSLLGILLLTVLAAARLVFDQGRSTWFLLLPVLPLGTWLVVRTTRERRRSG
jgi:hypothetical protein